ELVGPYGCGRAPFVHRHGVDGVRLCLRFGLGREGGRGTRRWRMPTRRRGGPGRRGRRHVFGRGEELELGAVVGPAGRRGRRGRGRPAAPRGGGGGGGGGGARGGGVGGGGGGGGRGGGGGGMSSAGGGNWGRGGSSARRAGGAGGGGGGGGGG